MHEALRSIAVISGDLIPALFYSFFQYRLRHIQQDCPKRGKQDIYQTFEHRSLELWTPATSARRLSQIRRYRSSYSHHITHLPTSQNVSRARKSNPPRVPSTSRPPIHRTLQQISKSAPRRPNVADNATDHLQPLVSAQTRCPLKSTVPTPPNTRSQSHPGRSRR